MQKLTDTLKKMNDAIPICRSIFNNWVYADPEHLKVWITMLGRARYSIEEKTVAYRDVIVKLKYGEFIFGYKQWSKDTGVSIQRLRTLISRLKEDRMIQETQATSHFTVYFIVNYPKFNTQQSQETKGFSDNTNSQSTVSQHPVNSQSTTNKEGIKKVKKVKKDSSPKKRTIVDEYYDLYFDRYKTPPVIGGAYGAIAKILNGIVGEIGYEETVNRLKKYFADSRDFIINAGHSAQMFRSVINSYVNPVSQPTIPKLPILFNVKGDHPFFDD